MNVIQMRSIHRLLVFTIVALFAVTHAVLSEAQVALLSMRQVNNMQKRILAELGLGDRPPPIPARVRRSFASNFGDDVEQTSESLRTVYRHKVYLPAVERTNDSLVFESQSLSIHVNQRIDNAILWLHLVPHNAMSADNNSHTIVHLRTSICTDNKCREADEIFHTRTNEPYQTVNVTNLMRVFYAQPATHLIVNITNAHIISRDERIFIRMINSTSDETRQRMIRDIDQENDDCIRQHLYTQCCVVKQYVSFADMGWHDWILKPRGVHSNFCSGSCRLVSASAPIHDQVNNKEYLRQEAIGSTPDPALLPCCRALPPMAALDIVVIVNGTIFETRIPDMIVTKCSCDAP